MTTEKADKSRHTVWLSDVAWNAVKRHYREDNCSAYNEYIEKAIRFYTGYLDTQNASSYLPRILSDVLEGKLDALGSRIYRSSHVAFQILICRKQRRSFEKSVAFSAKVWYVL